MPPLRRDLHEANRRSWDAATPAHNAHKGDQAAFLRDGGCTLFPEELELLGDLTGKRLVHLQCNCGQDTLSLARRGAVATGVDISEAAIDFARRLSADSGIPAEFERADLYDWFAANARSGRRFERAFCSYGVLMWLSDIERWARGVAEALEPGGALVYVDVHPTAMMFESVEGAGADVVRLQYRYSSRGEPLELDEGVPDYVGDALEAGGEAFRNPHSSFEFAWSLEDIVGALLAAGLRLEVLREYTHLNAWRLLPTMQPLGGGRFGWKDGPEAPLMLGLRAVRV